MTKNIDALILTNKAYEFSSSVDSVVYQDTLQGLAAEYAGADHTERQREELFKAEIYRNLGSIARALSRNELPEVLDGRNPYSGIYMRRVDTILPERDESLLPEIPGHNAGLEQVNVNGSLYAHDFLVAHPQLIDEYVAKNAIATKLIERRRLQESVDMYFTGHNAPELLDEALFDLDIIKTAFSHMR
jgi:hypothetical protein